jgi:hypothetical protein
MSVCGLDWSRSGEGPVESACEHISNTLKVQKSVRIFFPT